MMLSCERPREVLNYDPETGAFTWKVSTARCVKIGDLAGVINDRGYQLIRIDHHLHRAHRLAWLYMTGEWPSAEVDHINGIKSDNRFSNLREASRSQNMRNTRTRSDSVSGFKGVTWTKEINRWRAQIRINGGLKHIGYFDAAEDAFAAYILAAEELHGEFARFE